MAVNVDPSFQTRLAEAQQHQDDGQARLAYRLAVGIGRDLQALKAESSDEIVRQACENMLLEVLALMDEFTGLQR